MRTIVFGDDRSPGSDVAWLWINDQRWPDWAVDVVTVVDSDGGRSEVTGPSELVPWTPDDPRTPHPAAGMAEVRHLTADSDPRVVLGGRDDADLLVVGATGRGFLERWLHVGSTTEWLLHLPPAPLLVARAARPVREVLIAVDGSDPARRAMDVFVSLPWAPDTEVHALGVYDGWAEPERGLAEAAEVLSAAGIAHRTEQVRGRAADTILRALRTERDQLVVLGARGRSRLHRVMTGSTASAVARAAPGNVLVVA